ncbi:hypothetical protein EDD37DRAFT_661313 [Exophiala viscosa]|nr:hypothetical protein EDD37DRAFT_661313 [Exophiala viscosa]
MIRLPPTSISLSEGDVEFHLGQAQTYYGLLKQGYKKHDVARYLDDYREAAIDLTAQSSIGFRPVPSTFDLACRQVIKGSEHVDEATQHSNQFTDQASNSESTQPSASSLNPIARSFSEDYGTIVQQEPSETEDVDDQESVSPVPFIPQIQLARHAPRKSSLLRFAEAASPERKSEQTPASLSVTRNGIKSYRRRSLTYPYRSSEVDAQALISTSQESLVEQLDRMSVRQTSTQSEPNMEDLDSMPFELPPALSSTSTSWSFYDDLVPRPRSDDQDTGGGQTARRSSSLLGHARPAVYLPSSPPYAASPVDNPSQEDPTTTSPDLPTTPTPIRNAMTYARTEPRHHRHHYLDGGSFSVYNDSLPASSQPQTPADLSRGRLVAQNDAAYTAPPGMVRAGSASVSNQDGNRWDGNVGEQSPTVRAINLRERRNRELQRSVRAEGVRLQRLRMRDEALFTQGTAAANPPARGIGTGEGAPGEMLQDIWRDDLDADRVGEENFEPELDVTRPRTMRVVSGNARFEGWEGGPDR